MWWTKVADWSAGKYTLRAETASGTDATSYVGGEWTDIVVRTTVQDQQYTGLILYAIYQGQGGNNDTNKVGQWITPPREPFGVNDAGNCVSHRNADPKPYKVTFRVKIPAGSGTVEIRALVKYGLAFPAMLGQFYWPSKNGNTNSHLVLTEATATTSAVAWLQGQPGQSCNTVCRAQNMGCDVASLRAAASNPTSFYASVKKSTTCSLPMLRGCSSTAPAVGTEGCFYHDDACNRASSTSTWVQVNPCASIPVCAASGTTYPDKCCSYRGFKFCNVYGGNSGMPPATWPGPYDGWKQLAPCAPAGGYAQPTFPPAYMPVTAAAATCESTDAGSADGSRICACATGMPTSSQTDPPTPASTTPKPTAPPATANPTQPPPATTTTAKPATGTATTNKPATTAAPAVDQLSSGPNFPASIMATTAGSTFTVPISYRSSAANRVINVDILSTGDYTWYGKGSVNVGAATTTMTTTVTVSVQTTMPSTKTFVLSVYIVDASIYNADPANAYMSAAYTTQIQIGVNGATAPPTPAPTAPPSSATTQPPSATTTSPDATASPTRMVNAASSISPQASIVALSTIATFAVLASSSASSSSSSRTSGAGSRASMLAFMVGVSVMLLSFISPSEAHNWLTSPSRSNKGGGQNGNYNGFTSPPAPPKGGRVHAQVGPGQRFPVEWASGHGYGTSTYLVLLKAVDEYQMVRHTQQMIDDYLANDPASGTYMSDQKCKHVLPNGAGAGAPSLDTQTQITRPSVFRPYTSYQVYNKKADAVKDDKRAAYSSQKYPWIISAHRFKLNEDKPDEMDLVQMEIPTGQASGQYVVQYFWNGYYDAMDVNLLTTTSTDIWGSASTAVAGGVDLVHHCLFTPSLNNYQAYDNFCWAIPEGETADVCVTECVINTDQNARCDAVQVTPAKLPSNVVFPGMHQSSTKHYPTSCNAAVQALTTKGADLTSSMLCYNIRSGDAPAVGPPYKIVTDPDDPVFYSTCYMKKGGWAFADTCAACSPAPPPADYRFGEKCISCSDMNRNFFTAAPPKWLPIDTCQACDASLG